MVVLLDKDIELRLLLEEVLAGWLGGFLLEGQVHALMAAVLFGMSGLDPLDLDPQT